MLSSGGFLLFLSWLIFILVISYIAIKNFRESQNKVENKVQITLASVWFGFCSQYFVSIWEVTTIIFTSVLAAIIINQRTRNKLTLLKNTKLNFLGIENIQKWILSFFLILISLYLLFMQFIFENYANTKNPSNSKIVSIIKYYPNYYLIDFLAYSDLTKSRVNEAINLERISVELNPRNSKAFYQLGISYNYFNQFSNAENALLNALRNDPVNVYILDQLVRAQIGQDKLVEARQNFNKILMIDSEFKNIEVLRNLLKN
jgi:tetratricopeptide (TPR) repeat protein